MMKIIMWIAAGIFLAVCAYSDLRKGEISLWVCLLSAAFGGVMHLLAEGNVSVCARELQISIIPGILLMGAAIGTGEQIGKGDAWMLVVLGILTGMAAIHIFITALAIAALYALWKSVRGRAKWAEETAFAADLFLAYLLRSFAAGGYFG